MTGKKQFEDCFTAVAARGLCMGCGTCEAVCPCDAVKVVHDDARGVLRPKVDQTLCTRCGLCVKVCPGKSVDFGALNGLSFGEPGTGDMLGVLQSCWFAHSNDETIRFNSASGGLVTTLLLHALESGFIDGAIVTRMNANDPLTTEAFVATTPQEIISGAGSKYAPVSLGTALRSLRDQDGRFAVVGLPCHVHGIRKFQELQPKMRERIPLVLGLFCLNNATMLGTHYFLQRHGIDVKDVAGIRYRDKGWPGHIAVGLKDGSSKSFKKRPNSETQSRDVRLLASAFKLDFMIPRCLLCPDMFSELADISFGDPWLPELLKSEHVGKSVLLVRSQQGAALLDSARKASAVTCDEVPKKTVLASQDTTLKDSAGARIELRRILRLAVPEFHGKRLSAKMRGLIMQYKYWPSYITHRRAFWPLLGPMGVVRSAVNAILLQAMRTACRLRDLLKRRKPIDLKAEDAS